MNRHAPNIIALGTALLVLQACHDQRAPTELASGGVLAASVTPADPAGRHLVVFTAERVPADFAPDAWAAGFLGSRDVVVAILDTGIDYTNPDLAGLVDLDRSISFVPEDVTRHYPGRLPFSDLF